MPYSKAISSWFDKKRGLALGIAISGVGLGTAIIPKVAIALTNSFGWRNAYLGLAALILCLAIPSLLFLVRDRQDPKAVKAQSKPVEVKGLTSEQALRSNKFWLLAITFFCVAISANGAIAHVIPMLTDRGISPQVATSALSVAGLALIAGRLLSGYLLDKIFAPLVAIFFFSAPLLGLIVLYFADTVMLGSIGTILVGIGLGAEVDLIAFLLTRYLGNKAFGEIYGYLFAIFMLGSGIGPMLMGTAFDINGNYSTGIICLIVSLVIAIFFTAKLGEYHYPAEEDSDENVVRHTTSQTA